VHKATYQSNRARWQAVLQETHKSKWKRVFMKFKSEKNASDLQCGGLQKETDAISHFCGQIVN